MQLKLVKIRGKMNMESLSKWKCLVMGKVLVLKEVGAKVELSVSTCSRLGSACNLDICNGLVLRLLDDSS